MSRPSNQMSFSDSRVIGSRGMGLATGDDASLSSPPELKPAERGRDWAWPVGALLWLVVWVVQWPRALSFGDEVGYVGQIRLLLQGRFRPLAGDPGIWVSSAHGLIAKYPYFGPVLDAPLFAIHPRLIFVVGPLAALALVFVAARALRAWGRSPVWALVLLAHPAVTILARTAMTDLPLTAFVMGAWWATRRGCGPLAAALVAAAVMIKVTGFMVVGLLLAGEVLRERQGLRGRDRTIIRRIGWLVVGVCAGAAGMMALNFAANGTPWSAYGEAHGYRGAPNFSASYFLTTAPVHLAALLLVPPLLLTGAYPLWKRREFGPLVTVGGLVGLMCVYFFVDHGRSFVETLLLSPRLILPAVAFLLIGYADLLAALWNKLASDAPSPVLVAVVPALLAVPIAARHQAWQRADARALALATSAVAASGEHELGLTATAAKSGLLFPGKTVEVTDGARPKVVLCGTHYPSYRDADNPAGGYDCTLPHYRTLDAVGTSVVLGRETGP